MRIMLRYWAMLQAYRINATFIVVFACGLAAVGAQAQTAYDIMEKTIPELQAAMESGTVTARQLVEIYLARIAAYDKRGPALNAMVALNPQALAVADQLDAERRAGRVRGPLHGIPVVVKDNYETLEMPTTAGSIALATFHPRSDAFQVRRLKDAGAVIIGKTNMHELAAGITTISSSGGQTKNPYDLDRNPGGSSGGTGSAIAANFAVAGMGSDTCGSIRIPAAHNNLVGLRGTLGRSAEGQAHRSITEPLWRSAGGSGSHRCCQQGTRQNETGRRRGAAGLHVAVGFM